MIVRSTSGDYHNLDNMDYWHPKTRSTSSTIQGFYAQRKIVLYTSDEVTAAQQVCDAIVQAIESGSVYLDLNDVAINIS